MRTYIIRRILLTIPTLLMVTMLVFSSIHFIPGDILDLLMSSSVSQASGAETSSGGVTREWLEKKLGLDVPIHIQYGRWLGNILLHGDLGTTLTTDEPVWETFVRPRIPVSLELGLIALLILLLLAIPIGTYSAIRQNTLGDYAGRGLSILMLSIPEFWIATIVPGRSIHLFWLVAAHQICFLDGKPAGKPDDVPHPCCHSRDSAFRSPDAPGTYSNAGGAPAGLCADSLVEGLVRPAKAGAFSGGQTRRGKSQSPVAWMAGRRENDDLKPIDTATVRGGRRVAGP